MAIRAAVVIHPGVLAHAFELDAEVRAVLATLGGHAVDDSRTRSARAVPDRTEARSARPDKPHGRHRMAGVCAIAQSPIPRGGDNQHLWPYDKRSRSAVDRRQGRPGREAHHRARGRCRAAARRDQEREEERGDCHLPLRSQGHRDGAQGGRREGRPGDRAHRLCQPRRRKRACASSNCGSSRPGSSWRARPTTSSGTTASTS